MLSRWVRTWDSKVLRAPLLFIARCGVTPNMLTAAALVAAAAAGLAIGTGHLSAGALLLLLGGLLDGMDGELARLLDRETRLGAFLDSLADHCGDFAVYCGLLYLWLDMGIRREVILIPLALFGSMLGSQVRSRASMTLGIDTRNVGCVTRFERVLILVTGLFIDKMIITLWILSALVNISAVQRVIYVVRASFSARRPPAADNEPIVPYAP